MSSSSPSSSPTPQSVIRRQVPPWASAAAILGVILLVLWIVGSAMPTTSASSSPLSGKPAPAIEGQTADGKTFRLSDHQGKVVLVNFWATWCGPCRVEIPDLISLQKEYGDKGLVVVGLSRDESMDVVRPFVKEAGIEYPVLLAPDALAQAFGGVRSIPMTFLISRKGDVVYVFDGLSPRQDLAKAIRELL